MLRGSASACRRGAAAASRPLASSSHWAASATERVSGSIAGTSSRTSRVTSRAHRNPKTTAMTAPTAATIQLMTSPRRRHATPIANAIGHTLGPGTCGVSWLVSLTARLALDSIALRSRVSTMCRLSRRDDSALCAGRVSRQVADAVLHPAAALPARGHPHSSRSPRARGASPPRAACASRRCRACRRRTAVPGAWSRWSSGPSVMRMSRFGSTFAVTRKNTSA